MSTPVSANGRTYSERALESISKKSEGIKCYFDHMSEKDHKNNSGVRRMQDFLGSLHGIRRVGNVISAGQFKVIQTAQSFVYDLCENFPTACGFSINGTGKLVKQDNKIVVEDIATLDSVDLVSSPACTRGIFEQVQESYKQKRPDRIYTTINHKLVEMIWNVEEQKYFINQTY